MFWQANPKERLGYAILVVLMLAIVGVLGYRSNAKPSDVAASGFAVRTSKNNLQDLSDVVVHVVGAVKAPGVYHLPQTARAEDAVLAAGGASSNADLQGVNLASKLSDGQQLRVPEKGEAQLAAPASSGKSGKVASGKISLNRAGTDQLCQVPGIGPATAQKIILYRQAHGGFSSVEQLQEVGGIGQKKFARMQPFLQL